MDIEIKEVQEIIKNLESGSEISIKEEKYLKVAKLCVQLAAENVALKSFGDKLNDMHNELNGEGTGIQGRAEVACQQVALEAAMEEFDAIETPVTDRIVAEAEARGVEKLAMRRRAAAKVALDEFNDVKNHSELESEAWRAEMFAAQLREGAGK
jgi:hypothetical protein